MKMSYGRIWDDMVAMFRGHSELLLAVAGVFLFLPSLLSHLLIPEPMISERGVAALEQFVAHYRANFRTIFLLSLPTALGQAAILALLLDAARPTVAMALRKGLMLLPGFVLLNILVNFTVAFGLLLFILPGLYLIGRTYAAAAALVAENQPNPLRAYGRGIAITRGNGWRVLGMLAIMVVIGIILSAALTSVVGVVFALLASPEASEVATAIAAAATDMLIALALTLFAAALYRALAPATH